MTFCHSETEMRTNQSLKTRAIFNIKRYKIGIFVYCIPFDKRQIPEKCHHQISVSGFHNRIKKIPPSNKWLPLIRVALQNTELNI